jgi:HSP20 family protein
MFGLIPWRNKEKSGQEMVRKEEFPLHRLRGEFDAWFDRFFGNFPSLFSADWGTPSWGLDMQDTGKEVVIRAEAPGFEASDFDVQVSGNWLTIRAEQKQQTGDQHTGPSYSERRFQRSLNLPAGVQPDEVQARYRNGVLELHLPKNPEAQGKRIEVKS